MTSLGTLLLTLGVDASSYNRTLNEARNAAKNAGRNIEQSLSVKPVFDAKALQTQIKQFEAQKPVVAVGIKYSNLQSVTLTAKIEVNSSNVAQLKAQLERSLRLSVEIDNKAQQSTKAQKLKLDTEDFEKNLTEAVTKGTKKAQARTGFLAPLTGGIQNTIRGFQEGVGATYARKLTEGSIKNIESELGTSLEKIGERFSIGFGKASKFAGDRIVKRLGIEEGLAGVNAKVQQTTAFLNEIIDTKTLDRKFSVLETQIGKLIDDLLRLRGAGAQIGNIKGIAGAVGDIAATPLEGIEIRRQRLVKDAAQQAMVRSEQIESRKYDNADSVVFGIGGFAGNEDKAQRGKSSIPVAERLQLLTGERNPVIPIENKATDLSVNLGEGKLRFFAEAMQKIVMQNLAISPDAIETAAQAMAIRRENPNLPIGVAGYSAGGFTARSSAEILKAADVGNVRAVGIGTPRFSAKTSTTKQQFQTVLGEGDPLSKIARMSGAKDAQILPDGGKAHKLSSYLSADDTQSAILKQLNIKRDVPAELKSPVAFEMKAVDQEMEAAANDFMAAMQGSDFYLKTGLYKTVIAKIKINREKLKLLMEQATGDLDLTLAGYDEQLAEAEAMLNQAFGTGMAAEPALKARQRDQAIVQSPAIPPPKVEQPLRTKPLSKEEISAYNVDILKEVSRLSGGAGKGAKGKLVEELLQADAKAVRESFDAIAPLVQTGPKGGQSIKKAAQSASEKKAIDAAKEAEKRINDTLRIFVDAQGKRREEIAAAAQNEIQATLVELEQLRKSQSPDTRLQAGRAKGRLAALAGNFQAADVEGLARSPREIVYGASTALARTMQAEPSDSIRTNFSRSVRTPKAKAIATDLAVNTAGFAASQLGNNFGMVPGLAGDLVGALVARQAIAASAEIIKAYQASTGKQFKEIAKQAVANMRGRSFQREMGASLTGDLTGFAIGNASAMAANAGLSALNGVVPGAGLLGKIPLKGAAVAMATVPRIVNAREKALPVEDLELARVSEQPQPKRGLMSGLMNRAKADAEKAKAAIAAGLNKTLDALDDRYIKAPAQAAQTQSTAAKVQAAAKAAQKQVEKLPQELKLTTDQTYQLLVQEAAKLSKVTIKPSDMPRLMIDDAKLQSIGARALYSIKNNQIIITKEVAAMLSGTVSQIEQQQQAIADVVHESRHAFQFDFGRSNIAKQSLGFAQPAVALAPMQELPRNLQYNAMRSAQVANQQAGGMLPKSFQRTIARTEADAYAFEAQAPKIFSNVAQRVRSGATLPQPQTVTEAQPNQRMVDFFVKALQAKQAVSKAVSNPLDAIGNAFGALKESAMGGLGSQVSMARSPAASGGKLFGLQLPEIKIPEGLKEFGARLAGTRKEANEFGARIKAVGAQIEQMIPGSGALIGNLKQMALGFAGFVVLQQAIAVLKGFVSESLNAAMNLDRLKTAMNFAAGGEAAGGANMKFIEQTVSDLKIPLAAAREGFTQFSAATRGTKAEGEATKGVFLGMSQAATVLGLSAESTSGAFLALGQMASKGKVQAEELRGQLGERIPGAFGIAARAMNVTEAELNKMLETGQVMSDEFLPKFGEQLKKEFGGSAVDASKNAQSALFEFQNQTLKSQEAFGKLIQPAQMVALNLAAGAIKFLTENAALLAPVMISLSAAIGLTLFNTLAQIPGVAAAANAAFGLLRAGIAQTLTMMAPLALQIALVYAAVEIGRNVFDRFVPSDLGKRFQESTNGIESRLNEIAKKARETSGDLGKVGKPPSDANEDLAPNGIVDQGIQQLQRFNRFTGLDKLDKATGINFETSSASQFKTDKKNAAAFASSASKAAKFDENAATAAVYDVKAVDEDLQKLQYRRQALQGAMRPDKKAIADISKQIEEKGSTRKQLASGFTDQYENVSKSLKDAQESLKAIQDAKLPDSYKKQLTEPIEKSATELQAAKEKMDALQQSIGTVVDPTRKLLGTFEEINTKIEEISRNAAKTFNDQMFTVNTQALQGFGTDVDAGGKAAIAKAEAEKTRLQTQYEGNEQQLDRARSVINEGASQEILKSITTSSGKTISENSSITEIENAKKRLGDKDQSKKDILDQLKNYREARTKQGELRSQLPAAELTIKEANQQLATGQLTRQMQEADSATKRRELEQGIGLRKQQGAISVKRSRNQFYSETDAGIAEANLGVSQAQAQSKFAQERVGNLEAGMARSQADFDAGKISAAEYEKTRRELGDQIVEARAKAAESEVQIEEAKGKRIEALNRKRLEQIQEITQAEASALQRRQALSDAAFAMRRSGLSMARAKGQFRSDADAGVASAAIDVDQAKQQQVFAGQAAKNATAELERQRKAYKDGAMTAKQFKDTERELTDKITEARANGTKSAAALEEAYAKQIEAVNRQKLEQIEELNKKALAAIQLSQTIATTQVQGDVLNSVDAGEASQAAAARSITIIEQNASMARIAQKQKELAQINELRQQGALNAKDAADKELTITQELADAQAAQMQRQVQMQQQLRDSRIKLLEGTAKLETDQIDRAKQLAEAQGALKKAQSDLNVSRAQANVAKADRAFGLQDRAESDKKLDPRIKAVIAKQLNESGIANINADSKSYDILAAKFQLENEAAKKMAEAREDEFDLAKQSFEFEQKKVEAADKLLAIEAKRYQLDANRAKIQAVKDFRDAAQTGDQLGMQLAGASFEIAGNQSQLADEQLAAANDRLETDRQLADIGRQTLGINQQRQREEAFNADQMRRQNNEISYADQFVKAGGIGALNLPGRATGGDVAKGQPYMVGEAGKELFVPRESGKILSALQTEKALKAMGGNIPGRATGGNVAAGQPYMVGEVGKEMFMPSGGGSADGMGSLLAMMGALIAAIGVSVKGVQQPPANPAMGTPAAFDTSFKQKGADAYGIPAAVDTSYRPNAQGIMSAPSMNAPTMGSDGIMNKTAPSLTGSAIGSGGGGSEVSSKLDQLISVISAAVGRPNLTVSSPQPVNDAAKIYSEISSQQVSNANI